MSFFAKASPVSALAPMQDVTDANFMRLVADYGPPDVFFAEYFRIHEFSRLENHILEAILSKPEGRPVCAQFIGEDIFHIVRSIGSLSKYSQIDCLDLNMGCPAPKVYRKNVGGGLLREPVKIREILKAMREAWPKTLSVKMRLGFENKNDLFKILDIINESGVDFITLHGRSVKQLYRGGVDYEAIAEAARHCRIPLIANGDLSTAKKALKVARETGCAGMMIGRHAMRNPWIFRQIRELEDGKEMFEPKFSDVYGYITKLYETTIAANPDIKYVDGRLKKFLNFVGVSVDEDGSFLREMRLARGITDLMEVCKRHLLETPEKLYADEPNPMLCPRPNHES